MPSVNRSTLTFAAFTVAVCAATGVAGYTVTEYLQPDDPPMLEALDLPEGFILEEDSSPVMLPHCGADRVVSRHGELVAARSFDGGEPGQLVTFVVAKADDDALWTEIDRTLEDCGPAFDATDDLTHVIEMRWNTVAGPDIGDDRQWFQTVAELSSSVTGPQTATSPGVLVRDGDYVFLLTGYDQMQQDTLLGYAAAALD